MNTTHVVLRRLKDADGSRLLEASLTREGDLLIEGHDLGDGVERVFGAREYEWAWRIPAATIPALLRALGTADPILAALAAQFSDANAALLGPFLEAHEIPTNHWSRLGD